MNTNFFESLDTETTSNNIWSKYHSSMKGPVLFEGELKKHSLSGSLEPAARYFALQKDYLLYKKSRDAEEYSSAMLIKYARLVLPGQDEEDSTPESMIQAKFPLKICFKGKFSILYANSQEDYNLWIQAFNRVIIRTDFHSRFAVNKIIGSGAFANVYEAAEKATGALYAVKGFNKHYLEHQKKGKLALWNEISVLKGLAHQNLLQLYEVHETKNSIYLVFDNIQGGELSKLVDKRAGCMAEAEILQIVYGLLKGLDYMADRSLTHRDLKPSNIMLRKTNTTATADDVVIVDFGLAASTKDTNHLYKRCGTPGYIAPEVIGAKHTDDCYIIPEKCDLYSVGVIMYLLCTGTHPFERPGCDAETILRRNLESKVEFPDHIFENYSGDLLLLLKGLLRTDPARRLTAKAALRSVLFTYSQDDSELDFDTEEFPTTNLESRQMSIRTFKSLLNKDGSRLEAPDLDNRSIRANSKGLLEVRDNAGATKKLPYTNLYKQSLMKGAGASQAGSQSKDRSAENSPAHSYAGSSRGSSRDSSDSSRSNNLESPTKLSPDNIRRRQSQFGPKAS